MVVEYIRYSIGDDRAETFEEAYRRGAEALQASEHCERSWASAGCSEPTGTTRRSDELAR